jgi:hypothetical protein
MQLRRIAAAVLASVVVPGAAVVSFSTAAHADFIKRKTCHNNTLHQTDTDFFLDDDGTYLKKASWDTHANFHADRITWAVWDVVDGWVVVATTGGTSSTLNDVDVRGSVTATRHVGLGWRMSVFDAAMGNCSVEYWFGEV